VIEREIGERCEETGGRIEKQEDMRVIDCQFASSCCVGFLRMFDMAHV
jgi:hypothetical protein